MHHMGEASMKFADRTTVSFKAAMYLGVAALAVGMTSTAQAQAAEARQIDIPAQSLANTLTQIGRQTSSEVVFQPARSEEHTSELQSLMRISYAVFCLKKKKHNTNSNNR